MLFFAIIIVIFLIAFIIIVQKSTKKPTIKSEDENHMVITLRASADGLSDALAEYISKGWKVVNTTRGAQWSFATTTYDWVVILEKVSDEQTNEENGREIDAEINEESEEHTEVKSE